VTRNKSRTPNGPIHTQPTVDALKSTRALSGSARVFRSTSQAAQNAPPDSRSTASRLARSFGLRQKMIVARTDDVTQAKRGKTRYRDISSSEEAAG
jgi:hypothetical protein